jgi:hypothetical protein
LNALERRRSQSCRVPAGNHQPGDPEMATPIANHGRYPGTDVREPGWHIQAQAIQVVQKSSNHADGRRHDGGVRLDFRAVYRRIV